MISTDAQILPPTQTCKGPYNVRGIVLTLLHLLELQYTWLTQGTWCSEV